MVAEATRRIARVSPLVAALQNITKDDFLSKLPVANAKAAKKMYEQMFNHEQEAKDVLGGDRAHLSLGKDAFADVCNTARKELMLCEGLLATFRKHT